MAQEIHSYIEAHQKEDDSAKKYKSILTDQDFLIKYKEELDKEEAKGLEADKKPLVNDKVA